MKIGIIGSGHIGGTLGKHWAKAGHEVFFSSRHPERLKSLSEATNTEVGTPAQAARFGDVLLLAVPFGKIPELAEELRPLTGKILIDATNPYPERDGNIARRVIDNPLQTSTGYVSQLFWNARTVKAFNAVYYKVLEQKAFQQGDSRIAVPVASDDEEAKETVKQLIEDIGFAPQDLGNLDNSRIFEPNAPLYNQNLPIAEAEDLLRQQRQVR